MKKLQPIGTIELVSLPDDGVQDVPAKVDTGADSSAIWASNITEHNGRLSFTLFGKVSPFYTGAVLNTRDYKVISVKNSFGQVEFRYKVKLKLVLDGRTIQATVNLANREHNRYPILIGRRTLQGKFVVDVAKKPARQELKILMLSTKRTEVTGRFAKSLERYGKKLRITYAAYEDLRFMAGGSGNRIVLVDGDRDIAGFDLVHFKTYSRCKDLAAAAAAYLHKRGVPFIDQAINDFPATSKIHQYVLLSDHDIAVPLSICMVPARLEQSYDYLKQALRLPFVLKDTQGNKGEHNFLVKNRVSFRKACQTAAQQDVQLVAQAFVDNDKDYRILVFGTKIALVIQRARLDQSTHLNNTSRGAKATLIPVTQLPAAVQTASLAAAKLLGRQVAGVDFVQDKLNGLWYCLEVNDGPQLATGSFTAEKHAAFAAYLERKLSK
jgi:glutathione synthase/RimK-type ligase-like ATP-grasp enzyme